MSTMGIYQIRNKINNKVYIGQSNNIQRRWQEHIYRLNKGDHENEHLQNAWNKYGADTFEFSILVECNDVNLLNELETLNINNKKALCRAEGYNIASGGNRPNTLFGKTKDEIREMYKRVVSSRLNKWKETGNPRKGSHISDSQKEYLSKINKGKNHPMFGTKRPEHSLKVSGANNPRARKIKCIETNEVFNCAKDASKKYNVTNSTILKACRGVQKTSAGFHWNFIEEVKDDQSGIDEEN